MYRIIKFNRKAWLKPYIDRNTDLKKKQKLILKKTFFNAVFGKTMKNVRKNRDIKLFGNKKLFGIRTKVSYTKILF